MEPSKNRVPKVPDSPSNAVSEVQSEIRSVLADARVALPEEDVLAVVALRRHVDALRRQVDFMLTIESLILEGEIGAARMVDVPKDAPLSIDDFGVYALTEEERAPRFASLLAKGRPS